MAPAHPKPGYQGLLKQEKAPDPLALLGLAAAGPRIETLPAEVVQRSKQRVLDTIQVPSTHDYIEEALL